MAEVNKLSAFLSRALVQPHISVTDPHQRRVLALVAFWNLVTCPLGPILGILQVLAGEAHRVSWVWVLAAPISTLVNYSLIRSRYWSLGLWLQVLGCLLLVTASMVVAPDRGSTSVALVLPVLAAALCFDLRGVLSFQAVSLLLLFLNGARLEQDQRGVLIGSGVVLVAAFAVIAAVVRLRELMVEDRIHAERLEVERARALLSAGFDGTADVVDGMLLHVTPGFNRALGCSGAGLEGRAVDEVVALSIASGQSRDDAVPFLDEGGALRYLSVLRQALPGSSGTDEVIAVRDQTHEQLHKANMQFADRMVAVGTLASGVAHEINNALTTLGGHSELGPLALSDGDIERAHRSFASIEDASSRIAACVKQLQRFGDGREDEPGSESLNTVVESTIQLARHQLRHVACLEVDLAPDLPACRANGASVGQVVMNLLLNASDAVSKVSAPTIRAVTAREGNTLTLRVIDNGPGVPESLRQRIFQPFFTSKPEKGSGLGLSISANLAANMGGSIRLEPSEKGATFCFRLPVCEATEPLDRMEKNHREFGVEDAILLVDDEEDVLQVIRELLHPATVVTARSVEEAKVLWTPGFDIVISDLVMPDKTGLDLRNWLAERHPTALSRFVLMTGSAVGMESELRAIEPEQAVLPKPVSRDGLRKLLHDLRVASEAS